MCEVAPGGLNDSSGLLRRGEEGVAIACQQSIHMADESLHLAIAAACSVVDCHLPPCHLIQHCLNSNLHGYIRHHCVVEGRETSCWYTAFFILYEMMDLVQSQLCIAAGL